MAQRGKQFGAAARAEFGKGLEIRVLQQVVTPQRLFREVSVVGFEKRDPNTVMLCYCLDESQERIGGSGPFFSGHAARTIDQKIEVAALSDHRHVVRSPELN